VPGIECALRAVRPLRKSRRRYRRLLARIILVALVTLPPAFLVDAEATILLKAAPAGVLRILSTIGEWGDWPCLFCGGLVLFVVAAATRRLRMKRVVLCMLLASCVGGLVTNGVKVVAGRTRPSFQAVPQGFYGPRLDGEWTFRNRGFASFPSSHSSTSAAFLGVLFFVRGWWPLVAALLLPLVPLARISTRSHHLSDVAAGIVIGVLSAGLVWYHLYPRLRVGAEKILRRRAKSAV